jgi:hypothetical protein
MTDFEDQTYVEWIAREARRPVTTDPAARARIMAAVRSEPAPSRRRPFWGRLVEPHLFTASPIASLALAAGLVAIGVFGNAIVNSRDGQSTGRPTEVPSRVDARVPVSHDTVMTFVFIAPHAAKVALVGDFNDWSVDKNLMTRAGNGGVWKITVPLSVGRHLYSFVVDSGQWFPDPRAPLAPDDGFGHSNSVVLVSKGSAL